MSKESPTTTTENPAGSPKVSIGTADYERFKSLLSGVVSVPKKKATATENRRRAVRKR
jgi:hypothetical protein